MTRSIVQDSKEIWKDIKNYEGFYQVSNLGRIRSLDRIIIKKNKYGDISEFHWQGQIMTPCKNESPYYVIHLKKNNMRKRFYIHRLVAEAFIENIYNKNVVNHIDHNKHNNTVENLEWVTTKENVNHSREQMCKPRNTINKTTGLKYIGFRNNKYRVNIIIKSKDVAYDHSFDSIEEAIFHRDVVLSIHERKRRKHG